MLNVDLTFKEKAKAGLSDSLFAEQISFGISDNYVPNWGEVEALREYIANAYDENGTNFTIQNIENGILIEDNSERGIKLQDLVIGNSNSREVTYKIGTHGEGFKIGALALARLDKIVYIETIGNTIIFYLEYDEKLKSNILKASVEPNDRKKGSSIYLETEKLDEIKELFLFLNEDLEKVSDLLYRNTKGKKNHVYVNTLGGQKIRSFFSYSLHKKQKINRDRNIIESPYHDIALELFKSKDRDALKEWLKVLAEPDFSDSFEHEIIKYLMDHQQMKVFREIDYSLIQEVVSEMKLHYYDYRKYAHVAAAHRFVNVEEYLIFNVDNAVQRFCLKLLKNVRNHDELNFGRQVNGKYYLPLLDEKYSYREAQDFIELYQYLKKSTLLKSMELEGNQLVFELKNQHKADIIRGVVAQKNNALKHVMTYLYKLLKKDSVVIKDSAFAIEQFSQFDALAFTELPSKLTMTIQKQETAEELASTLFFRNPKQVVANLVYQVKGDVQYEVDNAYQLQEPIKAIFSYRDMDSYNMQQVLTSSAVLKAILNKAQRGQLDDFPYEVKLMESVIHSINVQGNSNTDLQTTMEEEFKAVFGTKVVVSTDSLSDKKAKYNGYTLFKGHPIIERLATALNVCLSSGIKGTSVISVDRIERPETNDWKAFEHHAYRKALHTAATLRRVLETIYEITQVQDKRSESLKLLLPYSHANDLRGLSPNSENALNGNNFKKIIREYCFEVYDRTHLVSKMSEGNVEGFNGRGQIELLDKDIYLGTFFHEYIHFATNLKDLDNEFEKNLAFVGILATKHKNFTDTELKAFLRDYKKWAGGK